jgi:hypothetical protein
MKRLALLLGLALAACAVSPSIKEKRAIIDVSDVERAITIEKEFKSREGQAPPSGQKWFETRRGSLPVIVTAPHATRPFREGQYRFSDGGGTAALALALHAVCDVTVLYTTYDSPSDPNFYDDNEFKAALGELVTSMHPTVVLDIHGSHPYRPYEIDIGSMDGESVLGRRDFVVDLVGALQDEGISNISHDWFPGSKNQTIIKFVSGKGVPALQLEFSSLRVTPSAGNASAHRFSQALQALARFLGKRGGCKRVGDGD